MAYTISLAIATNFWRPRQENFLPDGFLFNEDSESVQKACNLARLGNNWNEFTFFQTCKTDLWNKTRTAIEIISIAILTKELEETKIWIGI